MDRPTRRTRRHSELLQLKVQGNFSQDRKVYQAVSFGPNMLAVHTKILSSLAGEALQPSGGSLDIDLRSESSRRVAGLQVGLDMDQQESKQSPRTHTAMVLASPPRERFLGLALHREDTLAMGTSLLTRFTRQLIR